MLLGELWDDPGRGLGCSWESFTQTARAPSWKSFKLSVQAQQSLQRLSRQQDCHQLAVRPNAIAAAALRWEANTSAVLVVAFLRGHQRSSLALVGSVALLSKSMLDTLQTNGGPLCKRCARFV